MAMMLSRLLLLVGLVSLAHPAWSRDTKEEKKERARALRSLVLTLDRLGSHLSTKVGEGKDVAKQLLADYDEVANHLDSEKPAALRSELLLLTKVIDGSVKAKSDIRAQSRHLRDQIIAGFAMVVAPARTPDRQRARAIYQEQCASCHGSRGDGKGVLAEKISPRPTDFTDPDLARQASPFRYFNSIVLGFEGTAMPPFEGRLEDFDIWSLSYFLAELPYLSSSANSGHQSDTQGQAFAKKLLKRPSGPTLAMLAVMDDEQLADWLRRQGYLEDEQTKLQKVAIMRMILPYLKETPRGLLH